MTLSLTGKGVSIGGGVIQLTSTGGTISITPSSGTGIVNIEASGGGAVTSVFGRTGVVTANVNDYAAYYGQLNANNQWNGQNIFTGFTDFVGQAQFENTAVFNSYVTFNQPVYADEFVGTGDGNVWALYEDHDGYGEVVLGDISDDQDGIILAIVQRQSNDYPNAQPDTVYTNGNYQADGSIISSSLVQGANGYFGSTTFTGQILQQVGGSASTPAIYATGVPYSGGTGTTTYPYMYFNYTLASQPTTFSTNGTYLGINTPSSYTGNIFDFYLNGANFFKLSSAGAITASGTGTFGSLVLNASGNLSIPGQNTLSNQTGSAVQYASSTSNGYRVAMAGSGTGTALAVGANYSNLIVGSSPLATPSTGTNTWLANLVAAKLGTVTSGGATITNTASLFVDAASTAGANNYSLYANGNSAINGTFTVGTSTTLSNGVIFAATSGTTGDGVISVQNTNASGYSAINFLNSSGSFSGVLGWGNASVSTVANGMYLATVGNNPIYFETDALIRATLSSGGNLIIGATTTDNSNGVIQINASTSATSGLVFGNDTSGGQCSIYRSAANTISTPASWAFGNIVTMQQTVNGQGLFVKNSNATYAINGGGAINLVATNATAMTSGNRLGVIYFSSEVDTAFTQFAGASIYGAATENWSSTAGGTQLVFNVTPNTTHTGTAALILGQDLSATLSGEAKLSASTTTRASINIPSGTAPTSPVSGDIWFDGTHLQFRNGSTTDQLDSQVPAGLNLRSGTSSAMTSGGVTVSDPQCTSNSLYFFTTKTLGTITGPVSYYVSSRSVGVSFTITSQNALDTSTVNWFAIF
jgi:hypothetical protein